MPFKFNPFSGNFDQTGSGGGGSSYIDGEVATYNDLPLDGTAPLNSAWLVREASGVWPVSRKQAGIYIRTATAGSSRDADFTYAGTMPDVFSDAVLTIYDEASTTRTGQFNLGSITAGQNRVLTWPDANGTIARTEDFAAPPAIGSTTRNTGAFTTLSANNGTLTASAPVLDLSQTWNNSAVAFTGLRFNVTNTASASTSNTLELQNNGTAVFFVRRTGVVIADSIICTSGGSFRFLANAFTMFLQRDYAISWTNDPTAATSAVTNDLVIRRDAAATLAQRDGTNPQTFRLYNTFTDASNYERAKIAWSSNVLQIGTEKAGTGSARALEFQTDGTTRLTITAGGSVIHAISDGVLGWSGSTIMRPTSGNGTLRLSNAAQTDFNRLQFGGTDNTFPALKRSSTALQVRLADDSAYSVLDAQLRAQGTAPATSGATGTAGDIRYDADYIYVCTAANTWKRAAIATW